MKRKFFLNTATSLLMQVVAVLCGFVLPRFILEYYGSEVNGLTQSIVQFLGLITFLEMGIGQVIQSSLYGPLAHGDEDSVSRIVRSGTKYFRNIAYAFLGYIAVLTLIFPRITNQQFQWQHTATLIIAISIGSLAQYYFGMIDRVLLQADQRGYVQYTAQIVTTLLNTFVAVLMIRSGCSIQLVKIGSAVVFLLNPLAVRWYIRKHYRINRKIQYNTEPIKQKWNGVAQHISAVVMEGTDNVVLTLFSTLSNVSVYSAYFMVITGIRQFYVAVTAGIQSMVGDLWAKGEIRQLKEVFQRIEILLHFAVVFLFSCVAVLIVPFVTVYTHGLTDTNYVQPAFGAVLTLAYAVRCLRTPYNILILAGGHYKQTQTCHLMAAAMNLVISIAAVRCWGLVGIALGTLAALTYQTVWMVVYNSKNLICWPIGSVLKQLGVDALTAGVILLATCWIELSAVSYWGWFCMAVPVALIAAGVTAGMAWLFYGRQLKSLCFAFRR